MIGTKIWQRYFFKEILRIFTLFLFSFYFIFAVLDASAHIQDFIRESHLSFLSIVLYYLYQFIKYADLIIPLAVMVATIKVLSSLNNNRELAALQTSGMNTKTLLRPFFQIALFSSLFLYCNYEFFYPPAVGFLNNFYESHLKHSYRGNRKEPLHILYLKDNSRLIYQTTTPSREYFFDLFWVRSFDEIWRIKYLKADPKDPQAFFVDHIQRNSEGVLSKKASYDHLLLKDLKWSPAMARVGKTPIENRSIRELFQFLTKKRVTNSYHSSELATHFLYKCLMPLSSLLAVVAVAPYCIRYSRRYSPFLIYSVSLFGFIAFFTLIDASIILGENRVVSPYTALLAPFLFCGALFGVKFLRTR
ncbi:MAG TPA: hypothetical protein DCY54_05440 [Parachlamydiales bacterium]|nr:MAG: hypothetical protein A2Z85_03520 [Chlamydiae bacterium GWA2_50_15]OGN58594.1 MAG: hypothetical protein A3D18_00535 [Chlamydiae bacterium RIFCSPHIGHO2_02_FULL_49_29]OGN64424.1 MAG: hypothetical protein A3E26_05620 [Chlamydiae bacterium RIFCSPHIGHO2_12_FULL_49_32]OGN68528.1 MAG: hypothetical protein A3I15_01345 [Chlamydiae bacterium RIFCSPLOWO2_02_FULL_49_12]OGN72113.1 MAG: hypothetical protein A3G30_02050 [Chlamydiae bacterium RIFCSPLOWO2_12_FULL_49_12]HAZ16055.1 hypothetical protein [P